MIYFVVEVPPTDGIMIMTAEKTHAW